MSPFRAWFLFLAGGVCVAQSPAQPYRYAPPADWVQVVRDIGVDDPKQIEEGHSDFLLVDHQVRLGAVTSHYARYVERLTTQAAVDRSAQVSIHIDPGHEIAQLHEVRVLRNGRAIDKLADARRSLLNRERELENGLLNGRVTLHLLLQDVRVGDVLDYSYTLDRRDPFGERGYNDWFSTQWSEPVRRFSLRVLSPLGHKLEIRDYGALGEPVKKLRGAWVETTWRASYLEALTDEDSRPSWHVYYPRIEISEFADWNAVRNWARPLYRVQKRDDPALRRLIAEVRAEPDDAARVLKALRFVQDDIRYTGIEIGAGAYRPTQPSEVLSRRYGDCKDKTLLLITVLRELGIQAWPALVHSEQGHALVDRVPGPGAFDHVITKVRLADKDYWLDATASGQGGSIDSLVQADFGPALVIDDSKAGLQPMPVRQALKPTQVVKESYDLRQGREKPASFTVLTEYREELADGMRAKMRTQTATQLGKEYLDYYRKTYAGIRMLKPLVLKDDRARNVYQISETYEIDKPYEKNDKGDWKFYLSAYLIVDRAKKPDTSERHTPLARTFPMHVRHEIVALIPEKYDFSPEVVKITDPAFEYRSEVKYAKGKLSLDYDLRSASDHVPAQRLQQYAKQLERVYNDAFFTLTEPEETKPASGVVAKGKFVVKEVRGPSFIVLVCLLVGLAAGVALARWLARSRWQPAAAEDDAPAGIEGWLLWPGILSLFIPLLAVFQLCMLLADHGSAAGFGALGLVRQWVQAAMLLLYCVLIVLGAMGIHLLVKRAKTFPLLFQAQLAIVVIAIALQVFLAWHTGVLRVEGLAALIAPAIGVAICVASALYMARSRRVRATFVNHFLPNSVSSADRAASASPVGAT